LTVYRSRFRPWLDNPGPLPAWDATPEEQAAVAEALAAGAATACEKLSNLYEDHAEISGAVELIGRLGSTALPPQCLAATARALVAADYFHARSAPPCDGQVAAFRDYLVTRTLEMLQGNAAEALLWRAVYGRIADNWAPQAQLTRALQQELSASGLFGSVEVTLELNPPVAGGGRWIAMQTRGTLAELRQRLQRGEVVLLELIRDAEADLPAVNLVAAYHLEDELTFGRDGVDRVRLRVYDPQRGGEAVSLRLTLSDDRVQSVETPAAAKLPSVKALRPVRLPPVQPPLEGWRRQLGSRPPWTALWWARRLWRLQTARGE
jgi:hypothetical protein